MGRISNLHVEIQETMIEQLRTIGKIDYDDIFRKFDTFLDRRRLEDWQTLKEIYEFVKEEL